MMKFSKTQGFVNLYQKLPEHIQKKVDKQLFFLSQNFFHPGLRTKRMGGLDLWEARVDKNYRFTFEKIEDEIILKTVGPHDIGLGKK